MFPSSLQHSLVISVEVIIKHTNYIYQLANQVSDITVLVTESFVFGIFCQTVNFTTYNDFKHSLTTSVLIKFCKLFFYAMRIAVVLLMYHSVLYSFTAM